MGLTDNVAVVALIVSLIALIIASLQLLQALFGVAEGYWRCKEAIIGPWSSGTHRKVRWSELRVEVVFTTPDIDLLPSSQLRQQRVSDNSIIKSPYPLNPQAGEVTTVEIVNTIEERGSSSNLVTWIAFMQQLHLTYRCYNPPNESFTKLEGRPAEHKARFRKPLQALHKASALNKAETDDREPSADGSADGSADSGRTEIAIRYHDNSWDFMPSDVVRPLALMRLGPLIIMVVRLGMKWEALDPGRETLRATGNGFALTSTSVRGLGIVVQFNEDQVEPKRNGLIPSEASDKMICGILPTCRELPGDVPDDQNVSKDYPLKADNNIVSEEIVRKLLDDLQVDNEIISTLCDRHYLVYREWWEYNWPRFQFNEALILLCPFMPVVGSPCRRVRFLSWAGKRPAATFTFYEGRVILLSEIRKRCKKLTEGTTSSKAKQPFEDVKLGLSDLERYYPDTWYGDYFGINSGPYPRHHGRAGNEYDNDALVRFCRKLFKDTTKFFRDLSKSDEGGLSIAYRMLVGAHVSFGFRAAKKMKKARDDLKQKADEKDKDSVSLYRQKHSAWPRPENLSHADDWRIDLRSKTGADTAWYYVCNIDDFVAEVQRRRNRTNPVHNGHPRDEKLRIEAAWWMLVLRGIAWCMAIEMESPSGGDIRSSLYSSKTRVWMA